MMRKNLLGSKRKAINIYFAFLDDRSSRLVSSLQQLILYLLDDRMDLDMEKQLMNQNLAVTLLSLSIFKGKV